MIDFTSKTYRNLLRAQLDRVPDSLDKREGSLIQTAIGAGAYALEEFYLELDQVQRGAYLQTAVGQDLDYLAVLANVRRYPASAAVRLGVFNVDVPLGSRFSTIDGAESVNFEAIERVGPGQYRMLCETPGTIGHRYTGPILPITYIQGLTSAQLTDILVAGDDEEDDESLRRRAIDALTDMEKGTHMNVAVVKGGTMWNAIPDNCEVGYSGRFASMEEMTRVKEAIAQLMTKTFVEGTTTEAKPGAEGGVFEQTDANMALWSFCNEVSKENGYGEMGHVFLGGGSDAATTSQMTPTLCSCGVVGEWNHTDREYAVVETMFTRAKLWCAVVQKLDQLK